MRLIAAAKLWSRCIIRSVSPAFWDFYFMDIGNTGINCRHVHRNNFFAFFAVGIFDCSFHIAYCFLNWNNISQLKECSLQYRIGSSCAETDFLCDRNSVAGIEFDVVTGDISLYCRRQVGIQFLIAPYAVEKEVTARLYVLHHLIAVQICRIMAGNKVSLFYIIRRFNRFIAKTQVRNGHTARLLGVILEVCLYLLIRVVADNFYGVLVRANCSVCTQTPEFASLCSLWRNVRIFTDSKR